MSIEFRFALAVFAAFRLAELVAVDHGPEDAIKRFRDWCQLYHTTFYKLVRCVWCVGIWFAAPLAVWVAGLSADMSTYVVVWLAIAGGQAFLENIGGRSG